MSNVYLAGMSGFIIVIMVPYLKTRRSQEELLDYARMKITKHHSLSLPREVKQQYAKLFEHFAPQKLIPKLKIRSGEYLMTSSYRSSVILFLKTRYLILLIMLHIPIVFIQI